MLVPNSALLPENASMYQVALKDALAFTEKVKGMPLDMLTTMQLSPVVRALQTQISDLFTAVNNCVTARADESGAIQFSSEQGQEFLKEYAELLGKDFPLPLEEKIKLTLTKEESKKLPKFSVPEFEFLERFIFEIKVG